MYISPEAQRLLDDVKRSHEQLIAHFSAPEPQRRALRAVYEALESALGDIDEHRLAEPIAGGWSAAQVIVHVAEHDQKIEEATRDGVEHMIQHGLEHARDLWRSRSPGGAAAAGPGA